MNEEIVEALDDLLTVEDGSTRFREDDVSSQLVNSAYLEKQFSGPTRCPIHPECKANCDWEKEAEELHVVCDKGHEGTVPLENYNFYGIQFRNILEAVAEDIGDSLQYFDDSNLPRHVTGGLENGCNLFLVVSPADYEKAINEICVESLSEGIPAILITPENSIKDLLEIKSLFSAGNMIYTVPFTMLSESEEIASSLSTIKDIQELERKILEEQKGEHPVIYRVNSNPRYILTELNHMRMLRLAKELPRHSGDRLEKVGESAFSHLFVTYPETGGEDNRGSNLPDILFYISNTALPDGYEPILGIVDTKSGKDASFGSEPIEGKHTEYLRRGRRESVSAETLAHVFVILDFDGQQEIDFYDEMEQHYEEDECMVIVTAEALSLMLAAYLAHTVSNELKLVHGNFQTVIYPFFNHESFMNAGLSNITRNVGRDQSGYDTNYQERNGLLIITEEVVKRRIENCVESPNEVENILERYFALLPTV